jgi:hypothetical protein
MRVLLITLLILPIFAFGQHDKDYQKFVPKGITVKPLTDSANFVSDSLRNMMIGYFKKNNIDVNRCFIDKFVREDDNRIVIIIRDIEDMKSEKVFEKKHKYPPADYQSIGGTFEFDKKTKKLTYGFDQ